MTDDHSWGSAASWAGLGLLAAPLAYAYMGAKMKEPKKMESNDNEQVLLGLVMRLARDLEKAERQVVIFDKSNGAMAKQYDEIQTKQRELERKLERVQATLNEICQLRSIRDVRMAIRELLIMETPK